MKKIALLSCTPNGGKTYLDYLKNVLTYLLEIYNNTPPQQKLCQIDFFQLNGDLREYQKVIKLDDIADSFFMATYSE